jgi:hypothetical protein
VGDIRYVYFAERRGKVDRLTLVKIGLTDNLDRRMRELRLWLIFAVACEWEFAARLERACHQQFADLRWAQREPYSTEWFEVSNGLEMLIKAVQNRELWPWDHSQEIILP